MLVHLYDFMEEDDNIISCCKSSFQVDIASLDITSNTLFKLHLVKSKTEILVVVRCCFWTEHVIQEASRISNANKNSSNVPGTIQTSNFIRDTHLKHCAFCQHLLIYRVSLIFVSLLFNILKNPSSLILIHELILEELNPI